jgi:hypothetical protein
MEPTKIDKIQATNIILVQIVEKKKLEKNNSLISITKITILGNAANNRVTDKMDPS